MRSPFAQSCIERTKRRELCRNLESIKQMNMVEGEYWSACGSHALVGLCCFLAEI